MTELWEEEFYFILLHYNEPVCPVNVDLLDEVRLELGTFRLLPFPI